MPTNKDEICFRCERPILIHHPQYPLYCLDCARRLEVAEEKPAVDPTIPGIEPWKSIKPEKM